MASQGDMSAPLTTMVARLMASCCCHCCLPDESRRRRTTSRRWRLVRSWPQNLNSQDQNLHRKRRTMTSVPFPVFLHNANASLAAVGTCRIYPETCLQDDGKALYRSIVDKNVEQALETSDKQLRKTYMKQGVAMAKSLLTETMKLDVSIVDVQVIVSAEDILKTDGCLAACFLDAGCHAIVLDGSDLEAMDTAKIPRERLVAHFSAMKPTSQEIKAASLLASTFSVEYHISENNNKASVDDLQALLILGEHVSNETSIAVQVRPEDCDASNAVELASMIGELDGTIALVDPTPTQLGLCYAACMKTDRPDGLFTTVVCTRAGEALGLVYSSKVRSKREC
jgi:hypothetical protein